MQRLYSILDMNFQARSDQIYNGAEYAIVYYQLKQQIIMEKLRLRRTPNVGKVLTNEELKLIYGGIGSGSGSGSGTYLGCVCTYMYDDPVLGYSHGWIEYFTGIKSAEQCSYACYNLCESDPNKTECEPSFGWF